MIHIVWVSYCKTATWFTVRFIHLVMETVLDFLFSFQFWFPLCNFASFFSAYYFSLNSFALAIWCILLFISFFCSCVCVCFWFSNGWPHSVHAPCHHPLSKVNKCMCTLVDCHKIQTLKGAKLPPHLNQKLKKIQKRNLKEEKISKLRQIQSPKGKKLHVYWLVFCNVCDLPVPPHPYHSLGLRKQQLFVFLRSLSLRFFKSALENNPSNG